MHELVVLALDPGHLHDSARYPHHCAVIGDILQDDGARPYADVVPDLDIPQDRRVASDHHMAPYRRVPLALAGGHSAEGDALVDHHIVPDLCRLAYHHPCSMVHEEPLPYLGRRVYIASGQLMGDIVDLPGLQGLSLEPQPVAEPVHAYRLQARMESPGVVLVDYGRVLLHRGGKVVRVDFEIYHISHWSNSSLSFLTKSTDGHGPKQSLQNRHSSSCILTLPSSMYSAPGSHLAAHSPHPTHCSARTIT